MTDHATALMDATLKALERIEREHISFAAAEFRDDPMPPRLLWLEDQIVAERPDWAECVGLLDAIMQTLQGRYGESVCEREYRALRGAIDAAEQAWEAAEASRARVNLEE